MIIEIGPDEDLSANWYMMGNTEEEVRQAFINKYEYEPPTLIRWGQWWYAGPVREDDE